jgi:hypothetical protein
VYTEEVAAADKARLANTMTVWDLFKSKQKKATEAEAYSGLFMGTDDIKVAQSELRKALKEYSVAQRTLKNLFTGETIGILGGPEAISRESVAIDTFVNNLVIKTIPDIYRAQELARKQMFNNVLAETGNYFVYFAAAGTSASVKFINGLMSELNRVFGTKFALQVEVTEVKQIASPQVSSPLTDTLLNREQFLAKTRVTVPERSLLKWQLTLRL